MSQREELSNLGNVMRVAFSLLPIVSGLNLLIDALVIGARVDSPIMNGLETSAAIGTMAIIGVLYIILGLLMFTRWGSIAAYGIAAFFLVSAINLFLIDAPALAMRDLVIAVAGFITGRMINLWARSPLGARRQQLV